MMAYDICTAKRNDKIMEKDEGLRTLECLRGRLLAERAASRAANDESEQIGKKVIELEKQLKMEIKSRNKAEKRLIFLLKKLDSLNISYVSADETSSVSEKSEISSVSSSYKSQNQMELQKTQVSNISKCVTETDTFGERHNCPSNEDNLGPFDETISENSHENVIQSIQKDGDEDDNNGLKIHDTNNSDNEGNNQEIDNSVDNSMALVIVDENAITRPRKDEEFDANFDNSMALVVVDSIAKEDIPNLNTNVKDVLDALRYARESLQASMEMRKHMKSNIDQARLNGISC